MNRENLLKLARYLAGDVIAKKFDISQYSCKTAACAIGHGPYAGIGNRPCDESWARYTSRLLVEFFSNECTWCFSVVWRGTDNTALGAAKRIFWLLKHGLPEDWSQQMYGEAPLCYCDMDISEFMDEANTETLIQAGA